MKCQHKKTMKLFPPKRNYSDTSVKFDFYSFSLLHNSYNNLLYKNNLVEH